MSELKDEDILNLIGIAKYPEEFHFCGKISLETSIGKVDFSALTAGASLNTKDLSGSKLIFNATQVLFIENKANYFDFITNKRTDNQLVVYHGGCYSPAKETFFKMLKDASEKNTMFLHWGDIDYGGFSMLARLRQNIFANIRPYRMDTSELQLFCENVVTISEDYCKKLRNLLNVRELYDLYPSIEYMIKNQIRLEQEAMID